MANENATSDPRPGVATDDGTRRSVQVWFCGHVIIENPLPNAEAELSEAAMRRQWKSCRVLSEPVTPEHLVDRL